MDSGSENVPDAVSTQATTQLPTAPTADFDSTSYGQATNIAISPDRQDTSEQAPYSGDRTFQVKVWKYDPELDFSKPSAKFWLTIKSKNRQNGYQLDFTIAERQAFLCPACQKAINLRRNVLIALSTNGSDDNPSHHVFNCPKCNGEVNITAEW